MARELLFFLLVSIYFFWDRNCAGYDEIELCKGDIRSFAQPMLQDMIYRIYAKGVIGYTVKVVFYHTRQPLGFEGELICIMRQIGHFSSSLSDLFMSRDLICHVLFVCGSHDFIWRQYK